MTVSLIQRLKFNATNKSRFDKRTVASIDYPSTINGKTYEEWNNSVLSIPPVCSSSNGSCRIIEVSYIINFNLNPSGLSSSKDFSIPIVIGTIPLRINMPEATAPYPYSYQESMFELDPMKDNPDDEHKGEYLENDSNSYKPLYPVYQDLSYIKN